MREFHEAANIFPLMQGSAFKELKADIAANGLREPIWVHGGKIIDGRNRARACEELGIEPDEREWDGDGSLVDFIVSLNLHRRHLDESQRSMVGARIKPALEEEAKSRQAEQARRNQPQADRQKVANLPPLEKCKARDQAAAIVNVSPRTVEHASRVLKNGAPEVIEAVERGQVKVATASQLTHLPKDEQKEVVSKGPEAARERARELRQERNGTATMTPPIVEPPPEKDWPKIWWKHWSKLCGWMTTMARRGGFKKLAKNWPKEDIQKHIGLLKRYRRFIDQCISQLEEVA